MDKRCDLVVVGGGPAGLMAGIEAARQKLSTIIVEKDDRIGYPLNCAEAVTIGSIEAVLPVKRRWIKSRIERGLLVSPSGFTLELHHPRAGYVLDRPAMEQDLASQFTAAGGELITGCRAVGINRGESLFESLVAVDSNERECRFFAPVFIAADGVEGTIARLAGIDNRLDLGKTEALLQYRLTNISVAQDLIEIHLGSRVAPGSYAWVFPRGSREVTVGLGATVADNDLSRPRELLDRFVARKFDGSEIAATSCGTCPRYQGSNRLVISNVLAVGDAARVLDSITGAGIANALLSGKIAGRAAAAYVNGEVRSLERMYDIYPGQFTEKKHHLLQRYAEIKDVMDRLSDDDMDKIVVALDDYFETKTVESINPMAVFLGVVTRRPRLLKLARHLL